MLLGVCVSCLAFLFGFFRQRKEEGFYWEDLEPMYKKINIRKIENKEEKSALFFFVC
jgi:hypothetical protein